MKKNDKFQLGPIQQAWIKELREHPERQLKNHLGRKDDEGIKLCCLGQGLCILDLINGVESVFTENAWLVDGSDRRSLAVSHSSLGLHDSLGYFKDPVTHNDTKIDGYDSLAQCNDSGMSWPQIADLIEKHADKIFTHSV